MIAADLVVVAIGAGLLFPSSAGMLMAVFIAAVAIAAWKGTWRAGAVAIALSTAALALVFRDAVDGTHLIGFLIASLITTGIISAVQPAQVDEQSAVPQGEPASGSVVAFDRSAAAGAEAQRRQADERHALAKSLERAAAEQLALKPEGRKQPSALAGDKPVGVSSTPAQPRSTKR